MKLHQSRRITYIPSESILQNNSGEKTFAKTVLWSNWRQCCTSHGHTSSRWSDKMFFLCLDSIRTLALTVRGGGGGPGNFFDTWLVVMHEGNAADLMRRRIWFSQALTRWLDMRDRRRTGEDEGSRDLRWKDSWGAEQSLTPATWLGRGFVAKTWLNDEREKKQGKVSWLRRRGQRGESDDDSLPLLSFTSRKRDCLKSLAWCLRATSSTLRSTRLLDKSSFNNSAAETSWLTTEPSVRRPEVGAELRRETYINPSEASQTRLPSITASERLPLRLPLAVYLRLFVLLPKSDASPNPSPRIFTNCTPPSHNLLLFLNHHLLLRFSNYVIFSLCWLWWMPRSLRDGKVKIPNSAAAWICRRVFRCIIF